MRAKLINKIITAAPLLVLLLAGCGRNSPTVKDPIFEVMDASGTGLGFTNALHPTPAFNVFNYMYFYNGGGVGAGDFNNDGRIDLFFTANQQQNKLFLNTGGLHFRDVTAQAGIPIDSTWSTGVSVVDINNDGLLDIYVCHVSHLDGLPASHNQLLICTGIDSNGIPHYVDKAKEYGLDFSGLSTQAVFFDYDGDGDLDMYLLNHSIHQNGTFGPRLPKLATTSPISGDRLYRNDGNGHFTDVTKASGINSSVIGYGLGVMASDINYDGKPDLYVGNDFHENDYLYINQGNGTFVDEMEKEMMHTSQYTMGVDIADVNNDGYPEIVSMDMLPEDPYILRRSEGEDDWDIYDLKIKYGYSHQYTRNNLQFNQRNGHFSEIGLYSGIAATDWSWSPLWIDYDNDGVKDLFISNGIPRRLNDIDYINFVSNQEMQEKMQSLDGKDMAAVDKFPQIKLPSKFYHNDGQMRFSDQGAHIDGARNLYSNGALYADLDGDGDLDIVVNNIDDPCLIYRNTANDRHNQKYLDISFHGPALNRNALGAKVILFANGGIRTYEKYPVRGFLSSSEGPLHIGLEKTHIDSMFLVWPDNTFQRLSPHPDSTRIIVTWQKGLPPFDYGLITGHWKNPSYPAKDITTQTGVLYKHKENEFPEFAREPLLPHMLSTEGPALAVGDLNGDGLPDLFIGAAKREKNAIFLQQPSGRFVRTRQPDLENDSIYEDVDACIVDVNKDGYPDLVVASGGNEFYGADSTLTPRVYLGNSKGQLKKQPAAFHDLYVNASCIVPIDLNGDGAPDLFVGGRDVPRQYGDVPNSYLLLNDGHGHFSDVTDRYAPGLSHIGLVTGAVWTDIDQDGHPDLVVSLEWGGIIAFLHHGDGYVQHPLTTQKGWWNFILPVDLDGDGKIDLIAGNLGRNSRLHATEKEPMRMYYSDFDGNGTKEQLLTWYLRGRELPVANKEELEHQMPGLRKRLPNAEDFAKAGLKDIIPKEALQKADTLTADYFDNAVLINQGNGNFKTISLPWKAQLAPYRDAAIVDANGDSLPDILLVGNYYENNIQMGRYDADYGTLLINRGRDSFTVCTLNGLAIPGQSRHIRPIDIGGLPAFVIARNNDSARVIRFEPPAGTRPDKPPAAAKPRSRQTPQPLKERVIDPGHPLQRVRLHPPVRD
ncbi:MAG TPA: VCBS repeat-containing protein [Puia sp.]|nr:VCBS repeat-containing protein [Puia sp.]